eukprot:11201136-Lingulodinium_polyedra.AAC.1
MNQMNMETRRNRTTLPPRTGPLDYCGECKSCCESKESYNWTGVWVQEAGGCAPPPWLSMLCGW